MAFLSANDEALAAAPSCARPADGPGHRGLNLSAEGYDPALCLGQAMLPEHVWQNGQPFKRLLRDSEVLAELDEVIFGGGKRPDAVSKFWHKLTCD